MSAQPRESGTVKIVSANQDHMDQTVSNAHLKNIGMKRLKLVSAMLLSSGAENTAFAHHQPLSTMVQNVPAQLELTDLNVFHAQPQDSGTTPSTNVSALKTESGTVKTASANQVSTVQIVFNAQLKNTGMRRPKHASARLHSSGVEFTASAQPVMI